MELLVKEIFYVEKSGFKVINEVVVGENYCHHLKETIANRIGIYQRNIETDKVLRNEKFPVLIFPRMEVSVDYDYEECPYESYSEEYDYEQLHYCPKCGEKITIRTVAQEDVTEQVMPIIEKIKELESKRFSVKRSTEIFNLGREFNKIMGISQGEDNNYISPYEHE